MTTPIDANVVIYDDDKEHAADVLRQLAAGSTVATLTAAPGGNGLNVLIPPAAAGDLRSLGHLLFSLGGALINEAEGQA